MIIHILMWWRT